MTIIREGLANADLDFPVTAPLINLDFTNSQNLDERITFTRASLGTYVNRNGLVSIASTNIPRFDFDPVTGESKGLLIEESRQNLLTYSNTFTNGVWVSSTVSRTDNVAVSPDGTTNAALISTGSGTFPGLLRQYYTFSAVPYTFSIFVKKINCRYIGLRIGPSIYEPSGTVNKYPFFDLDTETFSTNSVTGVSFSYQKFPNDWYRLSLTYTPIAVNNVVDLALLPSDGNSYPAQGQGALSAYVYGAQFEQGTFPTSYIPTSNIQLTRNAEVVEIRGTNFSSWFTNNSPQELSVFYSGLAPYASIANPAPYYWTIRSEDFNEGIEFLYAGLPQLFTINGGIYTFGGVYAATGNIGDMKAVGLIDNKSSQIILQEGRLDYEYSTNLRIRKLPSGFTRMFIGNINGYGHLNGTLRKIAVYSKRMTVNQAVNLVR